MKLHSTGNILEVAVHSFQSALAAQQGGADRIELCTALQTGGLTPDLGLLSLILESVSLPVHVLIRPRPGNFVYDSDEFRTILRSISCCIDAGVHGVVIGCLDAGGNIDEPQLTEICDCADGKLDLTFHRAIDVAKDVFTTLDTLEKHHFNRVLTSGAASSAWDGRDLIRKMVSHTLNYGLSIMPGAGVNSQNIARILMETGCHQIHSSAKTEIPQNNIDPIGLTHVFNHPVTTKWESQLHEIVLMKQAIV